HRRRQHTDERVLFGGARARSDRWDQERGWRRSEALVEFEVQNSQSVSFRGDLIPSRCALAHQQTFAAQLSVVIAELAELVHHRRSRLESRDFSHWLGPGQELSPTKYVFLTTFIFGGGGRVQRDGRLDLAVANFGSNTVSILAMVLSRPAKATL